MLGPHVGTVISWVRLLSPRLSTNFPVSSGYLQDDLRQFYVSQSLEHSYHQLSRRGKQFYYKYVGLTYQSWVN